ncbi:MAG: tetratricopeptide repeat protein [Gemmatimonadota bacterium]|jgi:tetratricopeptide (TPR) repeat protein
MNPLAKLKEQARNHELREEWELAASAYLQVLHEAEEAEVSELALYNRVGDLYLRMGNAQEAVGFYEQAADRYAEAGLFNNAIALCNKALRYAPTRMDLLRKLGHFSASQGFITDARRWFLEYGERAIRAGDPDSAVAALNEYTKITDDPEAREFIARKLFGAGRKEAALAEYRRARAGHIRHGQAEEAATLEAEIRERFPEVEELEDPTEERADEEGVGTRWATRPSKDEHARESGHGETDEDGNDIAPPVGLPGYDDRPAAQAEPPSAPPSGSIPGLEQTSLVSSESSGPSTDSGAQPEGLETTRLADASELAAEASVEASTEAGPAAEPASEPADDMDWVRGRPSRPAEAPVPSEANGAVAPPAAEEEFVDLSAMLGIGEEGEKETRWFIEESEPTGDEDHDFAELLTQFKEKLAEHIAHDDFGAHYDLGIAFKEMGLLDEAIGEFQVALRGNGNRLRILEELGHCFFLKDNHTVAIKVLRRALELDTDDELEMIGVYYYLGRAYEEQGESDQARDAYERVVGLDINFQDVADRMARL